MMKRFLTLTIALLAAATATHGAIYLHLDDLKGESTSARHAEWIEVFSVQMGAANPSNRVTLSSVMLRKRLDKSSPLLMRSCATGRHLPSAVLDVLRSGQAGIRYMRLKMQDVVVTSVQQSAGGDAPMETVSLNFAKVQWSYTEIAPDGRALREMTTGWDLRTNMGSGGTISPDQDDDGMPDEYEQRYGLKVDLADGDDDADKDGLTNLEEFRAGTEPNSIDSIFKVSGVRAGTGGATLNWISTPGKTYRLMGAVSPQLPFEFIRFLTEAEVAAGTVTIPAGANFQFYVLDVE